MTLVRSKDKLKGGNTACPVYCPGHTAPATNQWFATDFATGNNGDTAVDNATLEIVEGSATIENSPDSCNDAIVPDVSSNFLIASTAQVMNFSKPWGVRMVGSWNGHLMTLETYRDNGSLDVWTGEDCHGQMRLDLGFDVRNFSAPANTSRGVTGVIGYGGCQIPSWSSLSLDTSVHFWVGHQACWEITLSCDPCDNKLRLKLKLLSTEDIANDHYVGWSRGDAPTTLNTATEVTALWDGEEVVIDDGSTITISDNIKYKFPSLIQGWSDEQRLAFQNTALSSPVRQAGLQELRTFDTFV